MSQGNDHEIRVDRIEYDGIAPDTYARIREVLDRAFSDDEDETESLDDFSDFSHWFAIVDTGALVAVTGLLVRDILVGDQPTTVAGIGGVATDAAHRGRGHARRLVHEALRFAHDQLDTPFGLLQCEEPLVSYYAELGWHAVEGDLLCLQSDGLTHRSPEIPMVIGLGSPS